MLNFQADLNKEQLEVVQNADGPCLVLAGAGSGKTRVITYRAAYLLERGINPENILLVTFTNKAAREMIERVTHLTPVKGRGPHGALRPNPSPWQGEGNLRPAVLPWSGTFHHIAYRVLKKYCSFLDYKNNFSVLDSDDSSNLIKQCLKDEGIDRTLRRFPSAGVLQSIISYASNSQTTIEEVLGLKHPHFLALADTIKSIAVNYEKRKKAANVMDFDDLLVNWLKLLEQSEKIREKHQEQFQYILVDEYQDTNKIQASIIRLIAAKHRNLLVVGDDAQSIYSFRAAEIKNILEFEKEYHPSAIRQAHGSGQAGAKIFRLETNYRSTPEILNLANDIIANNLNQYQKELRSVCEKCARPEVKSYDSNDEEAIAIAGEIEELLSEGVVPKDIAVLFRAAHHSQALEMELMKRGIAYDYRGGVRFFERAHVKDALAYLRILNNPTDEIAWRRVLNMQVGIGAVMAERIIAEVARDLTPAPLLQGEGVIGLPAKARVGWNDFLQVFQPLQDAIGAETKIGDLIRMITEGKYAEYLENEYPDYRERLQDLEQLAVFADRAENLDTFLAESSLQEGFRGVSVETHSSASVRGDGKIILSTIHQAKGLEWHAVFVINVSNGQFPNDRAAREDNGIEEERRLFYVAVTRAKKYLHISYLLSGGFGGSIGGPSLFVNEINKNLVDADLRGAVFDDDESENIIYVDEDKPRRQFKPGSFLRSVEEL